MKNPGHRDTHGHKALEPSHQIQDAKADAVLAGARTVFLLHGFSAATTDMIQRAASVSKATVYARYPTKEALFFAVIEAECETFLATVRGIKHESMLLHDVLLFLAKAFLETVLSPSGLDLFRVIVAEAPRFPELARRFYLIGPQVFHDIVADCLDEASLRGEIDLSLLGRDITASLFTNLVRGELHLQCLMHPGSVPSAAQRDQWAEAAVETFVRAYARPPRSLYGLRFV